MKNHGPVNNRCSLKILYIKNEDDKQEEEQAVATISYDIDNVSKHK